MGLLNALIDALGIAAGRQAPGHPRHRLGPGARRASPSTDGPGPPEHAGLLAAIEGQAPQAAKAFVEDILSIAGIARVGGRSAGEIAERFLARAANRSGLPDEARAGPRALSRHRGRSGPGGRMRSASLAQDAGLDLDGAL